MMWQMGQRVIGSMCHLRLVPSLTCNIFSRFLVLTAVFCLGLRLTTPQVIVEPGITVDRDTQGLFPVAFNLATRAQIIANATCGQDQADVFCKLVEHVQIFPAENRQCDICDARSDVYVQRHPIANAIDGSNAWWQSPSLSHGERFNFVTVTLDLGSAYQVAYVVVKAANSPRPGNWILERSLDGQIFTPWQYFAVTDDDCEKVYGVRPTIGVPTTLGDDQVICTSRYSRLDPLENGEIFVSIVNGRPGVFQPSRVLLDFTSARYIQLRLQKIRTLNADLMFLMDRSFSDLDQSVTRRYFYSIKDISIGGQCICYGHASYCRRHETLPERFKCKCEHNTYGDNCELCEPLFNQQLWRTGGIEGLGCEPCNCHEKASSCKYNRTVNDLGLSMNIDGRYNGGGVCLSCQHFTAGINCEQCMAGFYRPAGYLPSSATPCRRCNCPVTLTSTGKCVPDDRHIDQGLNPGDCICQQGYDGPNCEECAFDYHGFPNCIACPCNPAGTIDSKTCMEPCFCKANVDGSGCHNCKLGFFYLNKNNPEGCLSCFCFGITSNCRSVDWRLFQVTEMNGWVLSTLEAGGLTLLPRFSKGWLEAKTYLFNPNNVNTNIDDMFDRYAPSKNVHYWMAPMIFLGNRLSSYGGRLKYTVRFTLDSTMQHSFAIANPDVILRGNGLTIVQSQDFVPDDKENPIVIRLKEIDWYHMESDFPVSRKDFMTVLHRLDQILIKATYNTAQDAVFLRGVSMDSSSPLVMGSPPLLSVEQCQCPEGYSGLSCETCIPGWRRLNNQLYGGSCERCSCHNHSTECDPLTGACQDCKHNTAGIHCEECLPGFYGNSRIGAENDCHTCACPLITGSNFFAEYCIAQPTHISRSNYKCVNCQEGYEGIHCERCAAGYYGNPTDVGGFCRKCHCGGNIDLSVPDSCDNMTGACKICTGDTEGTKCEHCKVGFYGSAHAAGCQPCACHPSGTSLDMCHTVTGQCRCRAHFIGHQCDRCQAGYGDVSRGCILCRCHPDGSFSDVCDAVTGMCHCQQGVVGKNCDQCAPGYFGFSPIGCRSCNCNRYGSNKTTPCDAYTGHCICRQNVIGRHCHTCQTGFYGIKMRKGCLECGCDAVGSFGFNCNTQTGQCSCKPGVSGQICDRCHLGYFNLSTVGCQRCVPCLKPGHVCDQVSGACVCPQNTLGEQCGRCVENTWDYNKDRGCKKCNCTPEGSIKPQCDLISGKCECLSGYHGYRCESCLPGYHGFPWCNTCLCDERGVTPESCVVKKGLCPCNNQGLCSCKRNVDGAQCDKCVENAFSLQASNPDGCTRCHCFLRSQWCSQALLEWGMVVVPTRRVTFRPQRAPMPLSVDGYLVVNTSEVTLSPLFVRQPLYWSLGRKFLGDKTASYNGQLSFVHLFRGPNINENDHRSFPFLILKGNGFELHTFSSLEANLIQTFTIKLHEHFWHLPGVEDHTSRNVFMVVLQNLSAILIRATYDGQAVYAEVGPIIMEVGVPVANASSLLKLALGVEQCQCTEQYSGLSCQNPAPGYYRVVTDAIPDVQAPERMIGEVRPCHCYSHSDVCYPDTGICQDCLHNTTGDHCDVCLPGFYGTATNGTPLDCAVCSCPLPLPSNSFSTTCLHVGNTFVCTDCIAGYKGNHCESCDVGYYGNPLNVGDSCRRCNCDHSGSVRMDVCDQYTGQCLCLPGIEGLRCDRCPDRLQGVLNGTCISCYAGCTGELLVGMENLTIPDIFVNVTGVIYPWDHLHHIVNESNTLRTKLDTLMLADQNDTAELDIVAMSYIDDAENLNNLVNFKISKVTNVRDLAKNLLLNASKIEHIINQLYNDIQGDISELKDLINMFINNQTSLDIPGTVRKAQAILDEILARNFSSSDAAAKEDARLAELLSEQVKHNASQVTDTTNTRLGIGRLNSTLSELFDLAGAAHATALVVLDEESQTLGAMIADIEDLFLDINSLKVDIENILTQGHELNKKANDSLNSVNNSTLELRRLLSALEAVTDALQNKSDVLHAAIPYLGQLVMDAWSHALHLKDQAKGIADIFDELNELAHDPMQAALAFQSIVAAVKQAEAAAGDAVRLAEDIVKLANLDILKAMVNQTLQRSKQLLAMAEGFLQVNVTDLGQTLEKKKSFLNETEQRYLLAVDLLAAVVFDLDNLPQDIQERLNNITRQADVIVSVARQTNTTVSDILLSIDNDLIPKLNELRIFDIGAITAYLESDINTALDNAQYVKSNLPASKNALNQNAIVTRGLSDKINGLRHKIDEARNVTNKMKLSVLGNGSCVRTYRSHLSPGVTNEIKLSIKISRSDVDMLLLLIQQLPQNHPTGEQEYLALEIKNSRVVFSWDVGQGPGTVAHDFQLSTYDSFDSEAEMWYNILARRVGQIGQLKVWRAKNLEQNADTVSGKSQPGISIISFNNNASFFLGGVDGDHEVPFGLTSNAFYGCIGDVFLDGESVGVYNFQLSTGICQGCSNVPKRAPASSTFYFNGEGYASNRITTFNYRLATAFFITLEFRTLWGNSHLFFAGNLEGGEFVSIDLFGGHVVAEFYLGGMSKAKAETADTYNTNQWVNVHLERKDLQAFLQIFLNGQADEQILFEAVGPNAGLELMGQLLYIGGLPGDFPLDRFTQKEVIATKNLLGCIRRVAFAGGGNAFPLDLSSGTTVGVIPGCIQSGKRKVGFYGDNGYVRLDGISFGPHDSDVSFAFHSQQEHVLLLLASDRHSDNFYSMALVNGRLEARLSASPNSIYLTSTKRYNDGLRHYVTLLKIDDRLQMLVDDVIVGEQLISQDLLTTTLGSDSDLFFGSSTMNVNDMAASDVSLDGCIGDIIINGQLIDLSESTNHIRADIGRCPASLDQTNGILENQCEVVNVRTVASIRSSPSEVISRLNPTPAVIVGNLTRVVHSFADLRSGDHVSSCSDFQVFNADVERGAKSFGNGDASFVELTNIRRSELRKNFNLSFDFRTFYDSGLFVLLKNANQSAYFVAQLFQGRVELIFTHTGQEQRLTSDSYLSDGNWHSVDIVKRRSKLALSVNSQFMSSKTIDSRLEILLPLYIGGLSVPAEVEINMVKHSLRGCVRHLHLNSRPVDMAETDVISNVEHCYANIEPGVGFTGQTLGVYDMEFSVLNSLTVELEFRTSDREGIFFAISSSREQGLTLELHDGKVIFTLRSMGEVVQVNSTNENPTEFCGNLWHAVRVALLNNIIQLTISGEDVFATATADQPLTPDKSAFMIGGIFSYSSVDSVTSSRHGFRGCMRNLLINGIPVDWYQLEVAGSILLTGCPV